MKKIKYAFVGLLATLSIFENAKAQTLHSLPTLGYEFNALEPFIDAQTMEIHYTRHHQGYINNLNKAVNGTELASLPLEDILKNVSKYSVTVRNNAGGHYNHTLFWSILTPKKATEPSQRFMKAINEQFGGLDSLKLQLSNAASKRFGSGWAWLSVNSNNKLVISSTANQDNPLMDVADKQGVPILGIDVWEHAYYLKYQNKRGDYLSAIWNVINWEEISNRYENLVPKGKFDDWSELKEFHKVMSQTFHPSEEGNLTPIKTRSAELMEKAEVLKNSTIPAEFDNKKVKAALKKLAADSEKLHKRIQKNAKDEDVKKGMSDLHDVFHEIIGLCSNEAAH